MFYLSPDFHFVNNFFMKVIRLFVATFLVVAFMTPASGQGFRVPSHYSFDSKESYHDYDKDVIKYANWLEKIAPGDDDGNVKRAGRFFGEWLSGASYVQVQQNVRISGLFGDSPEYIKYYQAGYVRFALKNKDNASKASCTYAGLKMVLKVYAENRGRKKDANLDDMLKLEDDGKLKNWVDQRME